jgi:uncharacterized protein DUF4038
VRGRGCCAGPIDRARSLPAGQPPAYLSVKAKRKSSLSCRSEWSSFPDGWRYSSGPDGRLTEQDAERYFADREAHGFNTAGWVDVACAGRDFPDDKDGRTVDGILPFTGFVAGGTNYTNYDLTKPNEAYFTRLDHIIEIAAAHDFYVFIDPIETIGWLQTLRNNGLKSAYEYGQYLGHRYKKYANVGWISGNDFNNWRVPADDALVQAVAKGIKSGLPINFRRSSLT